jgi:hypothetical protein
MRNATITLLLVLNLGLVVFVGRLLCRPRHFKETLTTKSNPNPTFQTFLDEWKEKNRTVVGG